MPHKLGLQELNIPVETFVPGRKITEEGKAVRVTQRMDISEAMEAINYANKLTLQQNLQPSSEATGEQV